jgi:uncharacterized protein
VTLSRRRFLGRAAAAGVAGLAPGAVDLVLAAIARGATATVAGYGPLVPDPEGLLDLPKHFAYRAFSSAKLGAPDDPRFARKLTNGDPVPPLHDGMGAFPLRRGVVALVRNHEIDVRHREQVDLARRRPYDPMAGGGTTTLWVRGDGELERSFPSLSGTLRNCAGGRTPWLSWLTAEECTYMPGEPDAVNHDRTPQVSKPHGYVFEVDARAEDLVDPVPIVGMGRFYHEAVAVDPETAYVYLTEDRDDGLLYRFRPDIVVVGARGPLELGPGDLAKGGVLEALRIPKRPGAATQNWRANDGADAPPPFAIREPHAFDWVRIPNVDPEMDLERDPDDHEREPLERRGRTAPTSTRAQGYRAGAARFARAEGIEYDDDSRCLYVCCTNGGPDRAGQIWRVDLERRELALVVEPNDRSVMEGPDNVCIAPHGDLIVCEDGRDRDRILGVTTNGRVYTIARNAVSDGELAGACFAPDGKTLYVNIQEPGITFAITGPWTARKA